MKVSEVFTPGSTPKYTYYERPDQQLEERLLDAIETMGYITSISGPSKCGKTVLCEAVLGKQQDRMLLIPGGGINADRTFWDRMRAQLDFPNRVDTQRSQQDNEATSASAKMSLGGPIFGISSTLGHSSGGQSTVSKLQSYEGPNGPQMLEHLRKLGVRLVVDDFHYIAPAVQKTLAQQFKEAARQGTTIVLVSITERSDQAIRANPDLRGRLLTIDIPFWTPNELRAIPQKGFKVLNVDAHIDVVDLFTQESVGSPQLMQALCLELCRFWKLEEGYPTPRTMTCPPGAAQNFLRKTVALANCKTAYDMLKAGPKVHGSPRKVYRLKNGTEGDIYAALLCAIPIGKPILSLCYKELMNRIESAVDGLPPGGASVVSALGHADDIVRKKLQSDRVLEWDAEKDVLNILDPYFLYYLRWSDQKLETIR